MIKDKTRVSLYRNNNRVIGTVVAHTKGYQAPVVIDDRDGLAIIDFDRNATPLPTPGEVRQQYKTMVRASADMARSGVIAEARFAIDMIVSAIQRMFAEYYTHRSMVQCHKVNRKTALREYFGYPNDDAFGIA